MGSLEFLGNSIENNRSKGSIPFHFLGIKVINLIEVVS